MPELRAGLGDDVGAVRRHAAIVRAATEANDPRWGTTATTTATFSLGNAHCTTTGTLNVTAFDASDAPIRDSIPFELDGDCQPP